MVSWGSGVQEVAGNLGSFHRGYIRKLPLCTLPQLVGVRACVCTRVCTHGHVCVTVRWVRGDRLSLPIRKRGETWYPPKPEMPWK